MCEDKIEKTFKKAYDDLKADEYRNWELKFGGIYYYFFDRKIYRYINKDFSDSNGHIPLKKTYCWALSRQAKDVYLHYDGIKFTAEGEAYLVYKGSTQNYVFKDISRLNKDCPLIEDRELLKNSIKREILNDSFWILLKKIYPIWINEYVTPREKKEEIDKVFRKYFKSDKGSTR